MTVVCASVLIRAHYQEHSDLPILPGYHITTVHHYPRLYIHFTATSLSDVIVMVWYSIQYHSMCMLLYIETLEIGLRARMKIRMFFHADEGNNLAGVVEGELKPEDGDGDGGSVKERQLQLLNSIISDVSEPNKQLMTKLNCATKCT